MSFESSSFDTEAFSQSSWRFLLGELLTIIVKTKVRLVEQIKLSLKI